MEKIYINKEDDRMTVAAILVKNKYTVRAGSQRRKGSKTYDYYVEYERNQDEAAKEKPEGTVSTT